MAVSKLKWKVVHGVLVCYHTAGEFGAESFDIWRQVFSEKSFKAYISGSSRRFRPTRKTRAEAARLLMEADVPLVSLTDDRVSRGIIVALTWMGVKIEAAPWRRASAMVAKLGVSRKGQEAILDTIQTFRDEAEQEEQELAGQEAPKVVAPVEDDSDESEQNAPNGD